MKGDSCSSCKALIVWAVTVNGKAIPIDAKAVPNGNVELVQPDDPREPPTAHMLNGKGERQTGAGGVFRAPQIRWQSHFVTCPNADQHRK